MHILHTVEFYNPSVGGAQEVVKQLSEHLVMLGHDVTVATTKLPGRKKKILNGVKIVEFDVSGNAVHGYAGKDVNKYQEFLVRGKFDVIMNYATQQWTADLMFEVIDKIKARKILVPCGFSGLYNPIYKEYFKNLPSILRQYDTTVYLSRDYRDINYARERKLKNIVVIPNGADEREFAQLNSRGANAFRDKWGISPEEKLLLTVGTHTGFKGHHESIRTFQKANIPNATLMIVGDANLSDGCYHKCLRSSWVNNYLSLPALLQHKRIIVVSLSRADTILAYQAADLFLFLSNIECSPLVLFESIASETPFIASDCGNVKEIIKWTEAGFIAPSVQNNLGFTKVDITATAKLIEKLVDDTVKRNKLGRNGRLTWEKKYTWEKLALKYLAIYKGAK